MIIIIKRILFIVFSCLSSIAFLFGVIGVIGFFRRQNRHLKLWKKLKRTTPKKACFIGYRSEDKLLAMSLKEKLVTEGFKPIMWEPTIPFLDPIDVIFDYIDESIVVLYISPKEKSDWMDAEKKLAKNLGKKVIEIDYKTEYAELMEKIQEISTIARPHSFNPLFRRDIILEVFFNGNFDETSKTQPRNYDDSDTSALLIVYLLIAASISLGGIAYFLGW